MYDSKIIRRTIKYKLKDFAQRNNFKFHKPNLLIREINDVLQIINFDIISGHFNCDIAIQPLYIPNENLILSFGDRLNYFRVICKGIWGFGSTQEELDKDLDVVLELLEKNAIEWFDKVNSPEDIIKFINNNKTYDKYSIRVLNERIKYEILGFSYLYENEYKLAKEMFNNLIKEYNNSTVDWAIKKRNMFNKLIYKIDNNPETIPDKLKEYIRFTKNNLKLK